MPKKCEGVHGLEPVKQSSSMGEFDRRGLFAKNCIPSPTYIGLDLLVHPVYFYPSCYKVLDKMAYH
jgi:hypothetical protein